MQRIDTLREMPEHVVAGDHLTWWGWGCPPVGVPPPKRESLEPQINDTEVISTVVPSVCASCFALRVSLLAWSQETSTAVSRRQVLGSAPEPHFHLASCMPAETVLEKKVQSLYLLLLQPVFYI